MAEWNTHLYCARKVSEKLNLEDVQKDLFLFGNLIPDVNPGWVIKPETRIEQYITHFDVEKSGPQYFWEAYRFYEKYEAEIRKKNPVYLGFLFHLWVDVKLTSDFMSRVPMSQMISRGIDVREWKWKDNRLFIKDFPQTISRENIALAVEAAKGIEEINVTENDLNHAVDFLENRNVGDGIDDYSYQVYGQESMRKLFDEISLDFVEWVKQN